MHRVSLSSLSDGDRLMLANLIQEYVTPSVISVHWDAALSGVHSDPVSFLSFHRSYIAGLEAFLEERGYQQWVPLPAWNPSNPIPEQFNIPSTGDGRLRNLDPNVSFFPEFEGQNLLEFESEEELGAALIPVHNLVHRRVGGVMNSQRAAPRAPIFWPLHGFIDDIWWEWQRVTVTVPYCIGLSLDEAANWLNCFGFLSTIKPNCYESGFVQVNNQHPKPYTKVPRGTSVRLYT